MNRPILALCLVLLAPACQQHPSADGPIQSVEPAATEAAAPKADEPTLAVARQADGTLKLYAVDRWGNSMDAVYENLEFLKRAAPTLERGLTPKQQLQLQAELERLALPPAP